jgi:hypothetical protein
MARAGASRRDVTVRTPRRGGRGIRRHEGDDAGGVDDGRRPGGLARRGTRSGETVPVRRRPARNASGRRQAEVEPAVNAERVTSADAEGSAEDGDLRTDRVVHVPDHHRGLASSRIVGLAGMAGRDTNIAGSVSGAQASIRIHREIQCGHWDTSPRPHSVRPTRTRRGPPPERSGRGPRGPWGQITGDGVEPADELDASGEAGGSSSATQSSSSARNVCQTA